MKECPNCGGSLEHEEAEPEIGLAGGYACDVCGECFPDDEIDEPAPDRTDSLADIEDQRFGCDSDCGADV